MLEVVPERIAVQVVRHSTALTDEPVSMKAELQGIVPRFQSVELQPQPSQLLLRRLDYTWA
jgi:hypothetical protein